MRAPRYYGRYARFPAQRVIDVRSQFSPFYGAADPVAGTQAPVDTATISGYIREYAPLVRETVEALSEADPRVEAAQIEQQIVNRQMDKKRYPLLAAFFDNEIAKLKARLSVLRSTVIPEYEKTRGASIAVAETKTTLAYVGIAIGVLLASFLAVKTVRTIKG
jgi:hypothetical protein